MLERSCGAVVYTEENGRRRYVLVRGGYTGLPKGHMEQGETEQETAIREIQEEVCVRCEILPDFRRVVQYSLPGGNRKQVVYFLAHYQDQTPHRNPEEFLRVQVLGYRDALRALTFENDRLTLRLAERYLRRAARAAEAERK